MEFGRVADEELDRIDFSLPAEPVWNKQLLGSKRIIDPKVYIGCAKWGRPEWVGKIYPPKTREKDFLQHYVRNFNGIELNTTHYKIYGERGIRRWADKANGRDFLFCPKLYKGITHVGKLKDKGFITNEFFRGIRGFGQHLGPVFIQVGEGFSPRRKQELFAYLSLLPADIQYFLEVRHPDWFRVAAHRSDLMGFLHDHGMGAVITDVAGRRDCVHMQLTIRKAFIRFVGNSLHSTDYSRIVAWVKRLEYWLAHGLEELYFFMHMHDEAYSPELTVFLVDQLNSECKLQVQKPEFIGTGSIITGRTNRD